AAGRRPAAGSVTDAAWDPAAWAALCAELDRWPPGTATLWWRDDDAGAGGAAFDRLLALVETHGVPIALAVVPAWLDESVAARILAGPAALRVGHHGPAHRDPGAPAPRRLGGKAPRTRRRPLA